MGLTRTGGKLLGSCVAGASTSGVLNSTGAMFVVGSSTAAESEATTWILASTNDMSTMDSGYPTRTVCSTGTELIFRGTYGTTKANFAWREWGIYNASASSIDGALLNRKLEEPSLGTKTNAQTWQVTAKVVISA